MAICDQNSDKGFSLEWEIENFNFCWHKTGERLESSLFTINTSYETSWRLWLYPRGENDGEYISCYLFRAEGGPHVVSVDFEFKLYVEDVVIIPAVSFTKVYFFKKFQREGLECFASRWKVYAPIASQKDSFALTLECTILEMNLKPVNRMDQFIRTVIATESISGIEVFDCNSSLGSEISEDNEIKPLLEDEPLINLNLSYFEKYLVLKIIPKSCGKIKCAVCKISIIKHGLNESPSQHVCSWIGEIKTSIWKCCFPLTEPITRDVESSIRNSFLLHYDFTFSTGSSVTDKIKPKLFTQDCLDISLKKDNFVGTVFNALEDVYRSHSFTDVKVQTKKGVIPAHKAIVCGRSSKLKTLLSKDFAYFQFQAVEDYIAEIFLFFLYSDIMKELSWTDAIFMYKLSANFEVELLKKKCAAYFKDRLSIYSAVTILNSADDCNDFHLLEFAMNYILTHVDSIFCTSGWKQFSVLKPKLAKKIMLLIFKKSNSIH